MIVWIVYTEYEDEGCTKPAGVFSTFEKAAECADKVQYGSLYKAKIDEFTVDDPPHLGTPHTSQ